MTPAARKVFKTAADNLHEFMYQQGMFSYFSRDEEGNFIYGPKRSLRKIPINIFKRVFFPANQDFFCIK
jgi:hypothetical protein